MTQSRAATELLNLKLNKGVKVKQDKRIVRRPWGRRKNGGWIIQPDELLKALKDGEIAEFGKLHVGAKQLADLVRLMRFPDQELLVSSNGLLEVRNIARVLVKRPQGIRTEFRKPKLEHSFRLANKAWLPEKATITVVIKPRKFK